MYASKPRAAGSNAAAAAPPDNGIAEPMRIVPSIGALARSGSEQSSVSTAQPSSEPAPAWPSAGDGESEHGRTGDRENASGSTASWSLLLW